MERGKKCGFGERGRFVTEVHSAAYSRDNDPFEIDLRRAREGA